MRLLAHVLGLRYRLLWAHVRTRNGKIALFFVGYLVAVSLIPLLVAGGLGAAAASIQAGRAEFVARIVLSLFFMNAWLMAVVLGFGTNAAFSDAILRRYPISAGQRMFARHLTAFLEPLWIFVLAVALGLAAGFHSYGVTRLWIAVPASVLLVIVNYLLARVMLSVVERLMASRRGQLLVFTIPILCGLTPVVVGPRLGDGGLGDSVRAVLELTPPFAAARLMAAPERAVLIPMLLLASWCAGLAVALVVVERLPRISRAVPAAEAAWNQPYDRVAELFGPSLGPLVGKMLRYYFRSPQVRFNYPFAAIAAALFPAVVGRYMDSTEAIPRFVFTFVCLAGVGSTGTMALNVFGFEASGCRRYFLLPVQPALILRAAAVVPLLMGGAIVPFAVGLWWVTSRHAIDARLVILLLSMGFLMLFVYQALGLWTSLLAARPIDYYATFGNRASFAANAVMMGAMMSCFFIPLGFELLGTDTVLRYWWVTPLAALGAAAFYVVNFRGAVAALPKRRERLISVLEGRA